MVELVLLQDEKAEARVGLLNGVVKGPQQLHLFNGVLFPSQQKIRFICYCLGPGPAARQ